jgi:hypothetical protein
VGWVQQWQHAIWLLPGSFVQLQSLLSVCFDGKHNVCVSVMLHPSQLLLQPM